jgi:hypothetical protein
LIRLLEGVKKPSEARFFSILMKSLDRARAAGSRSPATGLIPFLSLLAEVTVLEALVRPVDRSGVDCTGEVGLSVSALPIVVLVLEYYLPALWGLSAPKLRSFSLFPSNWGLTECSDRSEISLTLLDHQRSAA